MFHSIPSNAHRTHASPLFLKPYYIVLSGYAGTIIETGVRELIGKDVCDCIYKRGLLTIYIGVLTKQVEAS